MAGQARARFEAGEFAAAREAAVDELRSAPEDVELLRIAGRAGVEVGSDDAIEQLRRVVELSTDDAGAWSDLGDALATEGRADEAAEAFRKVLELNPGDETALTHLGHTAFHAGQGDEGVKLLEQAAQRSSENSTAAISLVEMYRSLGQHAEAFAAAEKVAQADPDDALYTLDVAELGLETGNLDQSADAFERLRELVDAPEQEVGALHGSIRVELERGDTAGALKLARNALAIDTVGRTAGIVAHLEVETGEDPTEDAPRDASSAHLAAQGVPPTRQEVEGALAASLKELRRFCAESRPWKPLG